MKVALVGSAQGWQDAPYEDKSWEIWSVNNVYNKIRTLPNGRWSRWFDIHETAINRPKHIKNLINLGCPVYVRDERPDIPNSIVYPLEEIKREFFRNVNRVQFFTSTIAYMIALAIHEGAEEISLFGINQALQTEYAHHLPCTDFWLGVAVGRGIKVSAQKHSHVLNPETLYK